MKKMSKKKKITLAIVLFVIIVIALLTFWKKGNAKNSSQAEYTTQEVAIKDIKEMITTTGKVSALNSYSVWPLSGIEGNVTYSDFEVGDTVEKGQVLYRISSDNLDSKIKLAKENLDRKKRSYARMKKTSQTTLEKYEKYSVSANKDGYIKNMETKVGDTITEGSTVIGKLYNNEKMQLLIPFSANLVSNKTVGKSATVILSFSGEKIKGKVIKVNDYKEKMSQNRVVRYVTIEVKNPGGISANDKASAKIGSSFGSDEGTFSPMYEENIVATVSGVVESVSAKEGSFVQEGDTIVSIKRNSFVTQTNEVNEQLENAKSAVDEAKAELKNLTKNKTDYEIKSPIAGKIVKKNIKQGDIINATTSKDPLCLIYDLSAMNFSMMIDETDVQKLSEGQKIDITADALPSDKYEGVITSISIEANISDGGVTQYPVTARVEQYGKMLPGMNVNGEVVVEEAKDAITIPSNALIRGNFVYVEDKKAKEETDVPSGFRKQEVTVGISDGTDIEIIKGLSKGDKVYLPQEVMEDSGEEMGYEE